MSDILSVTKRLRYGRARILTVAERQAAQNQTGSTNVDKYYTIDRSRAVELAQLSITIPANRVLEDYYHLDRYTYLHRILFMREYSAPSNFYFIGNFHTYRFSPVWWGIWAVRWRSGEVCHRYALAGWKVTNKIQGDTIEDYAGQIIGKNCVFEFWLFRTTFAIPSIPAAPEDVTLKTSILYTPTTSSDTGKAEILDNLLTSTDLKLPAFPWYNPIAIDNSVCASLDNL